MSATPHILVLGAGYAGLTAAARLARRARGATLTLVDASDRFVPRIRLHQLASGETVDSRPMESMLHRRVRFVRGWVHALDPERRQVEVQTEAGRERMPYDHLVFALGSRTDTARVPGVVEHALTLDGSGATRIARRAAELASSEGRVLVVGGGMTGVETASELAEALPGLRVGLAVGRGFGEAWSDAARQHVVDALHRLGVRLVEGARVTRLEEGRAHFEDGRTLSHDLAIWTAGMVPAALAREAGLPVDDAGRLRVEPSLQVVGHPELWAIGDAARVVPPGHERPLRMACATAMPQGAHVGDELARCLRGQAPRPFQFGFVLTCTSLGRRDGLIQWVDALDRPRRRFKTGRWAAWIKERIVRATEWMIRAEARGLRLYLWRRWKGRPAALPAPSRVPEPR